MTGSWGTAQIKGPAQWSVFLYFWLRQSLVDFLHTHTLDTNDAKILSITCTRAWSALKCSTIRGCDEFLLSDPSQRMVETSNLYCFTRAYSLRPSRRRVKAAEPPHERQLYDVRVDEQELGPAILLRSRDGLHCSLSTASSCIWQQDVFKRPQLNGHELVDDHTAVDEPVDTYQEKGVGQEGVRKDSPADPSTGST